MYDEYSVCNVLCNVYVMHEMYRLSVAHFKAVFRIIIYNFWLFHKCCYIIVMNANGMIVSNF